MPLRFWRCAAVALAFGLVALVLGQWLGGGLALGRRDAALALPTLLIFAFLFAAVLRSRGFALIAFGLSGMVAIALAATLILPQAGLGFGNRNDAAALLLGTMAALTLAAAWLGLTRHWRRWTRWTGALLLGLLWWLGLHLLLGLLYWPQPAPVAGRTLVLTSLPLRSWAPDGGVLVRDDPALVALRQLAARPLLVTGNLPPNALRPDDRLLLAHPAALPPAALIEIDRFVRTGGQALILADGLSAWPTRHGFGDPRNPPVTSLLTPLLDHWGIALAAPLPDSAAAGEQIIMQAGHRLALHSAGHFERLPATCAGAGGSAVPQPVIAICRIGKGRAVLLADADLLYAPLWQPTPAWAQHLRPADNLAWVAAQLNGDGAAPLWGLRPTWVQP